ncbi:11526_t:CDS:1, partial [Gigaspora rosea]
QYKDWPQLISKSVTVNRLVKYCKNTKYNVLRELPCTICSKMFLSEHWTKISVKEINLSLLEVDEKLVILFSDLDFNYRLLCIDESWYKILLDRNKFIGQNISESRNPFDLRVCLDCKRSLN